MEVQDLKELASEIKDISENLLGWEREHSVTVEWDSLAAGDLWLYIDSYESTISKSTLSDIEDYLSVEVEDIKIWTETEDTRPTVAICLDKGDE